ncbi:MAG TPA: EF-hand domain-containing protein [Pirellulales bacterium]|jgi:Ca2+-binding EF-hand superfamily protein|nr:EF-hand domain-containing protein [Pirellulales bacterium]
MNNVTDMLRRLDANGNGILEPSELNDRARVMLQRAGLSTDAPVSIEKVTAAFEQMRNQGGGGRFNRGGDEGRNPGGIANSDETSRDSKKEDSTPPLVPPFGETAGDTSPTVPGFGEELAMVTASFTGDGKAASATSSGTASSTSSTGSSSGSNPQAEDAKIRGYATSMMKQYDKNSNGVLEKEEWSQNSMISGNPARYDKNGDGKITLDELVDGLKNWNRPDESNSAASAANNRGSSAAAPSDAGGGNPGGRGYGRRQDTGGRSASSGTGKHFLTPKERLPDGLPDWFAADDVKGDGQVTMSEFASTWTEAKLAEFAKYDLNGDGVITPDEVLKVSPPKK